MDRRHRPKNDDRGVVTLELVLAMPVLLMLIIGTVVMGNFLSVKTQTVGLARLRAPVQQRSPSPFPATRRSSAAPVPHTVRPDGVRDRPGHQNRRVAWHPVPPHVHPRDPISETVTMRCGG